ncbi:hypothetical protein QTP88_009111 [Uroleucon formosanum]
MDHYVGVYKPIETRQLRSGMFIKNCVTGNPQATDISKLNLPCRHYNCHELVCTDCHTVVDMTMGAHYGDLTNEKTYKDLQITTIMPGNLIPIGISKESINNN